MKKIIILLLFLLAFDAYSQYKTVDALFTRKNTSVSYQAAGSIMRDTDTLKYFTAIPMSLTAGTSGVIRAGMLSYDSTAIVNVVVILFSDTAGFYKTRCDTIVAGSKVTLFDVLPRMSKLRYDTLAARRIWASYTGADTLAYRDTCKKADSVFVRDSIVTAKKYNLLPMDFYLYQTYNFLHRYYVGEYSFTTATYGTLAQGAAEGSIAYTATTLPYRLASKSKNLYAILICKTAVRMKQSAKLLLNFWTY